MLRNTVATVFSHVPQFRGKGRLVLLFDRLLTNFNDPNSYLAVGRVNGMSNLLLDLRIYGQKFAFYYRELESELLGYAMQCYRPGCFIDVGASIGLWSVPAARLARKQGGRVIAFEPVPTHRSRLEHNLTLNGVRGDVLVQPVALGKENCWVRMRTNALGAADNSYISDTGDLEVSVHTLDSLAMEHGWSNISFLKIDTEGYDPLVIAGSQEVIRRDRPVIFVEFLRDRMAINQLSIGPTWNLLVNELGYRCARVTKQKVFYLTEPADYENLFFLPPGFDPATRR